MSSPLFHVDATAICPHGGRVITMSSNRRVFAGGLPVATVADEFVVADCPFAEGYAVQPCVRVWWVAAAGRVLVNGQPVILQTSTGACLSAEQRPQGSPVLLTSQSRVLGR